MDPDAFPPGRTNPPDPAPAPGIGMSSPAHDKAVAGETGSGEPPAPAARPVALVDASALVALADRDDAAHVAAVAAYRDLVAAGYALFTTNVAVAETFDLLRAGLGFDAARQWLRDCRLPVYTIDEQDDARARELILTASDDRALSLTDALSLAVMGRLGVSDAFAVDQHVLAAMT